MTIRPMKKSEEATVRALGRRTFETFESLFVPRPKDCLVACGEDEILGSVLYKYYFIGDKRVGYVDYIFVDEKAHGQGLGGRLLDAALETMKEAGAQAFSAIVRDDNAPSWRMFLKREFKRVGIFDLVRSTGLKSALVHTFFTPMWVGTGMDLYVKDQTTELVSRKSETRGQLLQYLFFMLLCMSSAFFSGARAGGMIVLSVLLFMGAKVLGGYLATLSSDEAWDFRVTEGGLALTFFLYFSGAYLLAANWYPRQIHRKEELKTSRGRVAFFQWCGGALVVLTALFFEQAHPFFGALGEVNSLLLAFHGMPFYPFASFGGRAIYDWHRGLYLFTFLFTGGLFFLHWF